MNSYDCTICGSQTDKKPCGLAEGKKGTVTDRDNRPLNGFGSWNCPKCGKGVKVIRRTV